jgi:small subunit ribosomal protein S5
MCRAEDAPEAAPEAPEAAADAGPAPRGKGKRPEGGRGPPRRGGPQREKSDMEERVVQVSRVTKVVKGGKQMSFRAVVVVGNKNGKVGVGVAKAKEVIIAVQKAVVDAKKTLSVVPVTEASSVPHKLTVVGNGSCRVMIRPALAGSGITAGGAVRAVLELAGYKNVNAKMLGASNPLNNGRATLDALRQMRTPQEVAALRGLTAEEVRRCSHPALPSHAQHPHVGAA